MKKSKLKLENVNIYDVILTIFFGYIGAHKFYRKEFMSGFFYFFSCGGLCFLWIFDSVKIINLFIKSNKRKKRLEKIKNDLDKLDENRVKIEKQFNEIDQQLSEKFLDESKLTNLYYQHKTNTLTDNYVVFDVETTGLDPTDDKIIEISAIKYIDNEKVETFSSLINPERNISDKITKLTGITNEELLDAESALNVLIDFIVFIEDYTLVAHNAQFDYKMLISNLNDNYIDFPKNKIIDTLGLAQIYFDREEIGNYKLETFKKYFNLNVGSHRALDDCITCAELYKHCALRKASKVR